MKVMSDERSRTNPGHGYPAYTETKEVIKLYPTRQLWEEQIEKLANPSFGTPKKFTAIIYREVEVQKKVIIKID